MTTPAQESISITIAGNARTTQRPDFKRADYVKAQVKRALCNAAFGGSGPIRDGGETYLPKWPAEKPEHYKIRAAIVQFARYYARTVEAAVGMICGAGTPVEVVNADPLIAGDIEDIDGQGTHIEVFAKHLATDCINGGFTTIFVDYPPIPPGITLRHDEDLALGLRPFWVLVPADRILSWIIEAPNWARLVQPFVAGTMSAETVASYAKQVITRQVVMYEPTDVVSDAFGAITVDRYRVLRLTDDGVTYTVWEKRKADGNNGEYFLQIATGFQCGHQNAQPLREIPLAVVYGGRKVAPFVAEPAMMSLAELNIDHYQVSADRRYLMRLCHAPTLFMEGIDQEADEDGRKIPIKVGPNSVVNGPIGSSMKYVSADPKALDSSKEEQQTIVDQMSALGMAFLGVDGRWNQTATGRVLDDSAEGATHSTIARGLQDGLEQAFRFHAIYRGVTTPPEVMVKTVTASPQVDPQIASVLWQAVVAHELDMASWIEYIRTGALPDDIDQRLDMMKLNQAMDQTPPADPSAAPAPAKRSMKIVRGQDGRPTGIEEI